MSVRHLFAAAPGALAGGFGFAAPVATYAWTESAGVGAYTLTAGRFWGTAAALLGLLGVVAGGLALSRSVRRTGNSGRKGTFVALVAGVIGVVGGGVNLAVADGGPGTGNGVVGGALAMLLGLIAVGLGGLALARSRRTADRLAS